MVRKLEVIRLDLAERAFLIEAESAADAAAIVRTSVPDGEFEATMPPVFILADEDIDLKPDVSDDPPPGFRAFSPNVYFVRAQKREWRWVELEVESSDNAGCRAEAIERAKTAEFNPGVHAEYFVVDVEKRY